MSAAVAATAADTIALACPPDVRAWVADARGRGLDDEALFLGAASRALGDLVARRGTAHPHVVVASLPKSGSTWLNALLVAATGFRPYLLNTLGHDTERSVDPLCVPMALAGPTVGQEHMPATTANLQWLRALGVRPVVLVRSIADLVVSTVDHCERTPGLGPAAHAPRSYDRWPRARRIDFTVRCVVPWMLSLYASWCAAERVLPVHWVRYESLAADPAAVLAAVLAHVRIPASVDRVGAAVAGVDPARTRHHVGRPGRGAAELATAQRAELEAVAAPFAGCCDLARIGLA